MRQATIILIYSLVLGIPLLAVGVVWLWKRIARRGQEDQAPKYKKTPFYLYVKEGKLGLETFVVEGIELDSRYRVQLIAFLTGVIEELCPPPKPAPKEKAVK